MNKNKNNELENKSKTDKLTIRPWIKFLTLVATCSGWSLAKRINVERKFLHFFLAVFGDICDGVAEAAWVFAAVVWIVNGWVTWTGVVPRILTEVGIVTVICCGARIVVPTLVDWGKLVVPVTGTWSRIVELAAGVIPGETFTNWYCPVSDLTKIVPRKVGGKAKVG